jgi:hypothetical protein
LGARQRILVTSSVAIVMVVWMIASRLSSPTVNPNSEALDIQLQAVEITVAAAFNTTVEWWDAPPQDICVTAALSPDVAAAEGYSVLAPRAIKAIGAGIDHRATVRPMNDCGLIGTLYGLVTQEGHRAWIIMYYDADSRPVPGKDPPGRWSERDDFNIDRKLRDDAVVQVSNGYMWDDYSFDLKSSQGKVRIAHARRSLNLQ